MLTETEEVLSRRGVMSLADLEQRLYEEIGSATLVDILNHSVGGIFANASKCITVISAGGVSTDTSISIEQSRVVHSGNGYDSSHESRVPIANIHNLTVLSTKPQYIEIHKNGGPKIFSKTLLGELVGDIFAIQGIYAGADPDFEESVGFILGRYANSFSGLSTPLVSILLLEWANLNKKSNSLRSFVRETNFLSQNGNENYKAVANRLANRAKWLAERGLILYETRSPTERNVYMASSGKTLPYFLPLGMGRDTAVSVLNALLEKEGTIEEVAKRINYTPSYTGQVIYWLFEMGCVELYSGRPKKETSAIWHTGKSKRLCGYLDSVMGFLGFDMKKSRDIFVAPDIDVDGLVQYRKSLIDSIVEDPQKRATFEEACRVAYKRHVAQFGKNGTITPYAQQI